MKRCYKCTEAINLEAIHGLHPTCFGEWFGLSVPVEFHDLDPKATSSKPSSFEIRNTFYHGRYMKYSARLGSTTYILKIQEESCPELPHVEYVCNKIASSLNIDVPSYYLIDLQGRTTFVTRNFMQDYTGTLHHLYKFLPPGEESHNCEEIIRTLIVQTGKPADIVKFINICLFDALVGNNDRHGRNLGIIETANMKTLAPMYDNPSVLGIQGEFLLGSQFNPSGSIWTKKSKEPKIKDYIEEFTRLGYQNLTHQFCKKIISQTEKIQEIINDAHISSKMKIALTKLVTMRIGEITHE